MIEFWSIICNNEHSLVSSVYHCDWRYYPVGCNAGRSKMKDDTTGNLGFKFHLWKLLGNIVLIAMNSFKKEVWNTCICTYRYILANFHNRNRPEKSSMPIIRNLQLVLRLNMGFHSEGKIWNVWRFFEIQEFLIHVPVNVFTMQF